MANDTICNICNKDFYYKSKLAIHQTRKKSCAPETTVKNIEYICCGKDYKTLPHYKQHIKSNLHKTINEYIQSSVDKHMENIIAKLRG